MIVGNWKLWMTLLSVISLTACGGGGGGGDGNTSNSAQLNEPDGTIINVTGNSSNEITSENSETLSSNIASGVFVIGLPSDASIKVDVFKNKASTSRFLSKVTFGPSLSEIDSTVNTDVSSWLLNQFEESPSQYLIVAQQYVNENQQAAEAAEESGAEFDVLPELELAPSIAFWENSITGQDQLRQRMVFALSQIIVVSTKLDALFENPLAVTYFQDILTKHAFGNYRDLLEEVTYSPAMATYLTYLRNQKGDDVTGRVPDENYARELMQLFSIGLVMLNQDGSLVLDDEGKAIETYTNDDITGLAKVFTGLSLDLNHFYSGLEEDEEFEDFDLTEQEIWEAQHKRLKVFDDYHSSEEKTFLGLTIPANTKGEQSITMAIDHLMAHQNIAPFIARQLIQRFVTSHPSAEYIQRVAQAFESGLYTLPNGTVVGEGKKGDLKSSICAVLLDTEHLQSYEQESDLFGKIREPILRFTHWSRAFASKSITPRYFPEVWDLSSSDLLAQHPFASPSVFNFYRPAYVAPGTESGDMGLTVPELQIITANSIPGYANFMTQMIFAFHTEEEEDDEEGLDFEKFKASFVPDYSNEISKVSNSSELIDHLDLIFTAESLSDETKSLILSVMDDFETEDSYEQLEKIKFAILMLMTSPDYLVQK